MAQEHDNNATGSTGREPRSEVLPAHEYEAESYETWENGPNRPALHGRTDGRTDGQTDGQTDKWTDKRTDGQTNNGRTD